MIENAAAQGARLLDGLRSIRSNIVHEVRGRGLMLAVELHPEAGNARRYCEALQGRGNLAKDTHGHAIRIAPPLVITSDLMLTVISMTQAIVAILINARTLRRTIGVGDNG
jgi:ornithine--oxo-acid transaminase